MNVRLSDGTSWTIDVCDEHGNCAAHEARYGGPPKSPGSNFCPLGGDYIYAGLIDSYNALIYAGTVKDQIKRLRELRRIARAKDNEPTRGRGGEG